MCVSVTITHTGLSVWVRCLHSESVCVNVVQNNVHCGRKLGIRSLVYITLNSLPLCVSVFFSV